MHTFGACLTQCDVEAVRAVTGSVTENFNAGVTAAGRQSGVQLPEMRDQGVKGRLLWRVDRRLPPGESDSGAFYLANEPCPCALAFELELPNSGDRRRKPLGVVDPLLRRRSSSGEKTLVIGQRHTLRRPQQERRAGRDKRRMQRLIR